MGIKISGSRLYYIDNLKLLLTILVILHHSGQPYIADVFWTYQSSMGEYVRGLGNFFAVNAAFFMGLFFMLSGFFLPGSYDRKSKWIFLKSKLMRLGIPVILSLLIMQPVLMFFYYNNFSGNPPLGFFDYFQSIYFGVGGMPAGFISTIGFPEMNFGHIWFVEHLLLYSLLYLLFRLVFKKKIVPKEQGTFNFFYIILIAFLISALTWFVLRYFNQNEWIGLFGFIQIEPAHLPQYLILFITGIVAYHRDWFRKITPKQGYISFGLGIAMAALICARSILPESISEFIDTIWFAYESFLAVFLCFGLIVVFRQNIFTTNTFLKTMSSSAYLAYILHYPIVVIVQYLLDKVIIVNAFGKFMTVGIISIIVTFCISWMLKKIRVIRKIF